MIYWKDVSRCNIGIAPFCYYTWSSVLVLLSGIMKKTAIICADWIGMVSVMDDATAGRLYKQMLAILNGQSSDDPEDLKYVLAHIRKFWADQDELYNKSVER